MSLLGICEEWKNLLGSLGVWLKGVWLRRGTKWVWRRVLLDWHWILFGIVCSITGLSRGFVSQLVSPCSVKSVVRKVMGMDCSLPDWVVGLIPNWFCPCLVRCVARWCVGKGCGFTSLDIGWKVLLWNQTESWEYAQLVRPFLVKSVCHLHPFSRFSGMPGLLRNQNESWVRHSQLV